MPTNYGEELKGIGQRLIAIGNDLGVVVPVPIPTPTPTNSVIYGATYSHPTLPPVVNYRVQAVPAFGWGSTEANLDQRIAQMSKAEMRVLTACNGPQRFRPYPPGPYDGLGDRILPEQHQNYANWIAEAVRRNNVGKPRRGITHVQMWNELKGYYLSPPQNRWNYEESTDLQNRIYDATKAVDSGVLLGGPYVAFSKDLPGIGDHRARDATLNGPWGDSDQRDFDVLEYYFAHGKFDFVCVDANLGCRPGYMVGNEYRLNDPPGTPAQAAEYFATVARWIRARIPDKPIWWSEIYPFCKGQVLWTTVAASLAKVPGQHVLMWWAESPNPPPPIV